MKHISLILTLMLATVVIAPAISALADERTVTNDVDGRSLQTEDIAKHSVQTLPSCLSDEPKGSGNQLIPEIFGPQAGLMTWLFLPAALFPLVLLIVMTGRALKSTRTQGHTRAEIFAFCIGMTLMISTALGEAASPNYLYPWTQDRARDLAGALAVGRMELLPLQGPSLHGTSLIIGPWYYLFTGLFYRFTEATFSFAATLIVQAALTLWSGSLILRRLDSRHALLAWYALAPILLAHTVVQPGHNYLGLPFALLAIWALAESEDRDSDALIPLASLSIGMATQMYLLNLLMLPGLIWVLILRKKKPPRRTILVAAATFLIPQLFTLFIGIRDLYSFGSLFQGSPAGSWTEMAFITVPFLIPWAVIPILNKHRDPLWNRMPPVLRVSSGLILAVIGIPFAMLLSGTWEDRFDSFVLPAYAIGVATLVGLGLDAVSRHRPGFRRISIPSLMIADIVVATAFLLYSYVDGSLSDADLRKAFDPRPDFNTFAEDHGILTSDQYAVRVHSTLGSGLPALPVLFMKSRAEPIRSRAPDDIVLIPASTDEEKPSVSCPEGFSEMHNFHDFKALSYRSRLKVPYTGTVSGTGCLSNQIELASTVFDPHPDADGYSWPVSAVINAEKPISAAVTWAQDPDRRNLLLTFDIGISDGHRRSLAVSMPESCAGILMLDGLKVNPEVVLVRKNDDGRLATRVEIFPIGERISAASLSVGGQSCLPQPLSVFDPPVMPAKFAEQLRASGFVEALSADRARAAWY